MDRQNEFVRGSNTVTKVERYNWKAKGKPGLFMLIDKRRLAVDHSYQRPEQENKIVEMTKNWSWPACGALIGAVRPDDDRVRIVDGQQRWVASMRRSDIQQLPVMVFEADSIAQEAKAFLDANTNRKPVTAMSKFHAKIITGDEAAVGVNEIIRTSGYRVDSMNAKHAVACVAAMEKCYSADPDALKDTFDLCVRTANGEIITNILLQGLFYLHKATDGAIAQPPLRNKVVAVGIHRLIEGARQASGFRGKGGAKVWAEGMTMVLNKGARQHRIKIASEAAE